MIRVAHSKALPCFEIRCSMRCYSHSARHESLLFGSGPVRVRAKVFWSHRTSEYVVCPPRSFLCLENFEFDARDAPALRGLKRFYKIPTAQIVEMASQATPNAEYLDSGVVAIWTATPPRKRYVQHPNCRPTLRDPHPSSMPFRVM